MAQSEANSVSNFVYTNDPCIDDTFKDNYSFSFWVNLNIDNTVYIFIELKIILTIRA